MITRKMTEDELAGKVICVNCKYCVAVDCYDQEKIFILRHCRKLMESYPNYVTGEIEEEEASDKSLCSEINHAGECSMFNTKLFPKS